MYLNLFSAILYNHQKKFCSNMQSIAQIEYLYFN